MLLEQQFRQPASTEGERHGGHPRTLAPHPRAARNPLHVAGEPDSRAFETSIWLVEVDEGTAATPHAMTREEIFVVLDGRADVRIGDDDMTAGTGDAIVVPAGATFEIRPSPGHHLRALCLSPVGNQARLRNGELVTPPWSL